MNKKKVLIIISVILTVSFLLLLYLTLGKDKVSPDPVVIIEEFQNNKEVFIAIKDYAIKTDGYLFIGMQGNMVNYDEDKALPIADENIILSISNLKSNLNFLAIYEGQDSLYFVRHDDRKYEKGIAYMSNGEIPLSIVKSKFLGDNWYYYESGKV